jgi:HD-GYP domain-containing protein (c-di-GMP phosphodiesterase class II)
LVVADIFDALRAKRPYRDALPLEKVFEIMRADAPKALDLPCLEALFDAKTRSGGASGEGFASSTGTEESKSTEGAPKLIVEP